MLLLWGKLKRRTSNVEGKKLAKQTYDPEENLLKRNTNSYSRFGIGCVKSNEIKLPSEATSLFDVQRWMFDVGRSYFKPTLYDLSATDK